MFNSHFPVWLRHAPTPSIRGFATLASLEAAIRGIVISVNPLALYHSLGDKKLVTEIYFIAGILGLIIGLLIPSLSRIIPRRFLYITGVSLYFLSGMIAFSDLEMRYVFALFLQVMATATTFVCFNAYLLDYVEKVSLGQAETKRLYYSTLSWTIGPMLGVYLYKISPQFPFVIMMLLAFCQLSLFLYMRLGNGKIITRAKRQTINPLGYLGRFFAQPRLVAGWIFAVLRSSGWWVYIVYLPLYAIENGLSDSVGGIFLSLSNVSLFFVPQMMKVMERTSVRKSVRLGFFCAGLCFVLSSLGVINPWLCVFSLFIGSLFLIFLDMCGGLPFLMAVKPSERTEMSAVYSSYRDTSGIISPGVAWLILLTAPLSAVFITMGLAHWCAFWLADTLPEKLGKKIIK